MNEFNARLRKLEDAIAHNAEGMSPGRRAGAALAIRHRRTRRSVALAAATVTAFAMVGGGGLWALSNLDSTPIVDPPPSPSPSMTPSASPSPSATPTPTPSADSGDTASLVDDATARELSSPSTGERWHERAVLEGAADVFDKGDDFYVPSSLYSVGVRGEATIAVAVADSPQPYSAGYPILGMFEIDSDGIATFIACPSTRSTDGCLNVSADRLAPGVVYSTSIHYASLTYPETVSTSATGELRTGWLASQWWGDPSASTAFGEFLVNQSAATGPVGTLGSSSLVAISVDPLLPELAAAAYGITTPYGSVVSFPFSPPTPVAFDSVTWDDGSSLANVNGAEYPTLVSPSLGCVRADVVTAPTAGAGSWTVAGTAGDGSTVLLPQRDNALAARVFQALKETSAEGEYAFPTLDAFLDARALVAIERTPGSLTLAVNSGAAAFVWDCV